jgi:hypothetical protein
MVVAALLAALVGSIPLNLVAQQGALPLNLTQQGSVTLSGTAKDEARKPYPDYLARAREVQRGQVAGITNLDKDGKFELLNLPSTSYVVELLDPHGKVVCTGGPFDMTKQSMKNDLVIDCDKVPARWFLLAAAAAAGITSGVVTAPPASPSK